MYLSEKKE
ncbi:hypothetical protein RDI58_019559 [Solanum bulbocastanum]|uniref:Uncharacterized protein n=1 Tax=Solanum bulbocastanum TaxID=147425 RepID=A0AAN8TBV8_SOLBU